MNLVFALGSGVLVGLGIRYLWKRFHSSVKEESDRLYNRGDGCNWRDGR
jgi:hypothetical protein